MVAPWKLTISVCFAVAARMSSYQPKRACESESMKSTLTPATPHERISGSMVSRSATVSSDVQWNHRITSTPRARA
jgi:hypothetical protein